MSARLQSHRQNDVADRPIVAGCLPVVTLEAALVRHGFQHITLVFELEIPGVPKLLEHLVIVRVSFAEPYAVQGLRLRRGFGVVTKQQVPVVEQV